MLDKLSKIFSIGNFIKFFILFSGLAVSICAAYVSVTGMSLTLSGQAQMVIIIMAAIELTKLVIITALKLYYKHFSLLVNVLAILSVLIMMVITSFGVYGFLSGAYQTNADSLKIDDKKIALIESKIKRFDESIEDKKLELTKQTKLISDYTDQISKNYITYVDSETGQMVKSTSSAKRKLIEKNIEDTKKRRDKLDQDITILQDTVMKLEVEVIELQSSSEASAELGILRYISRLTGYSLDVCANTMILLITSVVDPLAVLCLVMFTSLLGKNLTRKSNKEEPKQNIKDNNPQLPSEYLNGLDEPENVEDKNSDIDNIDNNQNNDKKDIEVIPNNDQSEENIKIEASSQPKLEVDENIEEVIVEEEKVKVPTYQLSDEDTNIDAEEIETNLEDFNPAKDVDQYQEEIEKKN